MVQHSEAFDYFINQMSAQGHLRADGYDIKELERVRDDEREELENLIVSQFNNKDYMLAVCLPKMKYFNGIKLLEEEFKKCQPCSIGKINFAKLLFNETKNKMYLDSLFKCLSIKDANDRNMVLRYILECDNSNIVNDICKELCQKDNSPLVRFTAALGILYCNAKIASLADKDGIAKYKNLLVQLTQEGSKSTMKILTELER